MGPEQASAVPDRASGTPPRRGRPPVPRERVLRAAEALLADAGAPAAVSMDDVAAAAGVGKGTLFRAFGSRDGLLDAVFAERLDSLRSEVERPGSPVGPGVPAIERAVGVLDLLLVFKLDNPGLVAARELSGSSLLRAPHYRWVHGLLRRLAEEAGASSDTADHTAHLLLGGLRAEVLTDLLAAGSSPQLLRRTVAASARRLLG